MTVRPGSIVQIAPLKASLSATLQREYAALVAPGGDELLPFLNEHGPDVDIVMTSGRVGITAELMDAMPKLRVIINHGVGYEKTDAVTAQERGIAIAHTPDVLNDCVADTAVGGLIDVMRGLSSADRFVRRGDWPVEGNFSLARKVSGARVGILGLGRIGRAIATRLEGFGADISYHNRRPVDGVAYTYVTSLIELAERVDVLVVAAAGGPGSVGLVSRDVLQALGSRGFVVNIARGTIVDEQELTRMLVAGELAGAALDVFAEEPYVPEDLLRLNNVVLLPHLASGTVETRAAMERLVLDNLRQFLADGTLVTPAPPAVPAT
ncbi:MAG: 2-hydroxyacid dehydrogenase [Nocardioidaceae bacterium]